MFPVSFLKRWRRKYFPTIITVDLEKLYYFTLRQTREIRPWTYDKEGKHAPLQARYDFVKLFLSKEGQLEADEIKKTYYYDLLTRPLNEKPRDGGVDWIYHDPEAQARRFMDLIRSVKQHGYIREKFSGVLDGFCDGADRHIARSPSGEIRTVDYRGRPYEGLMTVKSHQNFFSVWNGNHRLAVLMVFCESGYLKDKNIPVLLIS